MGDVHHGYITLGDDIWELSVDYASMAKIQVYTGGNMSGIVGGIFHFGLVFYNDTFSLKCNGIEVCPKGTRHYLFLDHNVGE